jgi:hypothetical protein
VLYGVASLDRNYHMRMSAYDAFSSLLSLSTEGHGSVTVTSRRSHVIFSLCRSWLTEWSLPGNTHWNVPRAPNPLFTGRQRLLNTMKDHLITEPKKKDLSVFVLQGIGGAGKSEVAIKFAAEHQDRCVSRD